MTSHDHKVRYSANQFIAPSSVVGFFAARHYRAVPWHDHTFFELGIVQSGSGTHINPRGIIPFQRGTVIFVPPGVPHEYDACKDAHVLNCFFRAELGDLELAWAYLDSRLRTLFNPSGMSSHRSVRSIAIRQLTSAELATVTEALDVLQATPPERRTRAREIAQLLIALDVVAGARRPANTEPDEVAAAPAIVTAARDILEQAIDYPWTLAELSAALYVGPFHLARAFRRSVGMPPMHYLARRRAERAAGMLATTDASIASVGAAIGWPDPSHFSRRFRDSFGMSPRAYRMRNRPDTVLLHDLATSNPAAS